jgi:hypothetical protein
MNVRVKASLAVAGLAGLFLMTGCASDAICASTAYPVAAVRDAGGQDCVDDDQQPPAGFVKYPAGKVPAHVGDQWDKYWADHLLNENGREVTG